MTTSRLFLLVLLGSIALGALIFGWNRHLKVLDLALALEEIQQEHAELRTELHEARQNRNTHLRLSSGPDSPPSAASAPRPLPSPTEAEAPAQRPTPKGFAARMQDPQFQAIQRAHARSMLDTRYADLFRRLNLPPAQLEQLRNLLLERDTVNTDVMAAAAAAGLSFREHGQDIAQLRLQAQEEVDASIAQALGPEGYATYQFHQQTGAQRFVVNQLEQRLSYSGTPLTPAQGDQLIQLLARTTPAAQSISLAGNTVVNIPSGGPMPTSSPPITDEAVVQAAAIPSPAQLAALRELQEMQNAMGVRTGPGGAVIVPAVSFGPPGGSQ